MEEIELYDLAFEYAKTIINSSDFQRLIYLSKCIEQNLKEEINMFKKASIKYGDALEYGKYHPNLKDYQIELSEAKTKLYSNELVIEYKTLEQKIQSKLNCDLNELKKSISNKFKLDNIIKISED